MMHPDSVALYGSGAYDAFCRTFIRNRVDDSRGALVQPSDEYLNMVAIFYKHAQPPAGFVPKTENGRFEYIMSFCPGHAGWRVRLQTFHYCHRLLGNGARVFRG